LGGEDVMQANHISSAKRAALEREIDERVYRLYGLTAGEIKLVEESAK
jgi:hypothetical protein